MKFTVVWIPSAEHELAELWMGAPDRQEVRDAADRIDAALAETPMALGESRSGNVRILFAYPLGVEFEVLARDRRVRVLSVWRFDSRSG